ncbi:MAG: hypothetical protein HYS70_05060 [Nitrospinae bacterium]|nr:hypothetical protein [Nitrospinota bacterium]
MEGQPLTKEEVLEQEDRQLIDRKVVRHEDSITVGSTNVKVADVVDDVKRHGELAKDIIEDEWMEKRLRQVQPHLEVFARHEYLAKQWDSLLLDRFDIVYTPATVDCGVCPGHACRLTADQKGHCGLTLGEAASLRNLQRCCQGTERYIRRARLLYDYMAEHFDPEARINLGSEIFYLAPIIWMVVGIKPRKLKELEQVVSYLEQQILQVAAVANPYSGLSAKDMESRAFHAGMLAFVAMETAELINITVLDHTSAGKLDLNSLMNWPTATTPAGVAGVDKSKHVVMLVGTGDIISYELAKQVKAQGLEDQVELCGLGDSGLKLTRVYEETKILGLSQEILKCLRLAVPDVIVLSDTSEKFDVVAEAQKLGIPVIAAPALHTLSLPDATGESIEAIVDCLAQGKAPALLVYNYRKAAAAALGLRGKLPNKRKALRFMEGSVPELAKSFLGCPQLNANCLVEADALEALKAASQGDLSLLKGLEDTCRCAHCGNLSSNGVPLIDLILKASQEELQAESCNMRGGRGPICHMEYRDVAFQMGFGNCIGFITVTGDCHTPQAKKEIGWLVEELSERGFGINITGNAAIAAAFKKDKDGKTVYEKHYSLLQVRAIVNVGESSANSHCLGGDTKLVSIAGKVPYRGNYAELADYQLNRYPTSVIVWGPATDEMVTSIAGWARMGIPVIVGPRGEEYLERFFLGDYAQEDRWWVYQGFTGKKLLVEPCPNHLIAPVEDVQEAVMMISKLVNNPNDMRDGRSCRLANYIDAYKMLDPDLPPDWDRYLRDQNELPLRLKFKLLRSLSEMGWEVDVKKGRILSFKRPDGRHVSPEEMFANHTVPLGIFATIQKNLVLKEQTRGEF